MLLEDSKIRDKTYKNPNQIPQISHTNYMELLFWVVGNGNILLFVSYHKIGRMISGCFWYMDGSILEVAKVRWFNLNKI